MQHCTSCDHPNPPGAYFCVECGAPFNDPHPAPPSARGQTVPASSYHQAQHPMPPAPAPTRAWIGSPPASAPSPPAPHSTVWSGGPPPAGSAYSLPVALNVTVQAQTVPAPAVGGATLPVELQPKEEPDYLTRGLYFLLVGWWLSLLWLIVAWVFNATIIGLPIGLAMLNYLPKVTTLRPVRQQVTATFQRDQVVFQQQQIPQRHILVRAVYFVLVGWWASLAWCSIAWSFSVSIIGMPIAFWMFDQVPAITTLARY